MSGRDAFCLWHLKGSAEGGKERSDASLYPFLTPLAPSQPHDLAVLLKFRDELVTCADDIVVPIEEMRLASKFDTNSTRDKKK